MGKSLGSLIMTASSGAEISNNMFSEFCTPLMVPTRSLGTLHKAQGVWEDEMRRGGVEDVLHTKNSPFATKRTQPAGLHAAPYPV